MKGNGPVALYSHKRKYIISRWAGCVLLKLPAEKKKSRKNLFTSIVWHLFFLLFFKLLDLFFPVPLETRSATKIIPPTRTHSRTHKARMHTLAHANTIHRTTEARAHRRGDTNLKKTHTLAHSCTDTHVPRQSKAMVGIAHLPGGFL